MNDAFFTELSAWLTQAGVAGTAETDILCGFCDRCVAAGLPLGRTQVFIDTLHPVHEGRLFRLGHGPNESALLEYGRTSPDALAASGSNPKDVEAAVVTTPYSKSSTWSGDEANGGRTCRIAGLAIRRKQSIDVTRHWQRHFPE